MNVTKNIKAFERGFKNCHIVLKKSQKLKKFPRVEAFNSLHLTVSSKKQTKALIYIRYRHVASTGEYRAINLKMISIFMEMSPHYSDSFTMGKLHSHLGKLAQMCVCVSVMCNALAKLNHGW